jgi:hypothetical protein
MIHHFNCPDRVFPGKGYDLVFDWDDETGEITGPSADRILADFREGIVSIFGTIAHKLTSTKNKTDLAAVVGESNVLPPELADCYPECEDVDPNVYDLEGNVVGQVDF